MSLLSKLSVKKFLPISTQKSLYINNSNILTPQRQNTSLFSIPEHLLKKGHIVHMIKLLLITTAYAYLEFLFLNSKFIKIYT